MKSREFFDPHKHEHYSATRYLDGTMEYSEYRNEQGELHRNNDCPAVIRYYPSGQVKSKRWHKDGLVHRGNDSPAVVKYYPSGKVEFKIWCENGQRNRIWEQPAYVSYYENDGRIKYQAWYKDDVLLAEGEYC